MNEITKQFIAKHGKDPELSFEDAAKTIKESFWIKSLPSKKVHYGFVLPAIRYEDAFGIEEIMAEHDPVSTPFLLTAFFDEKGRAIGVGKMKINQCDFELVEQHPHVNNETAIDLIRVSGIQ